MTEKYFEITIDTYDGQTKSLAKIEDEEQARATYKAYVGKLELGDVPTSTLAVNLNQVELDGRCYITLQRDYRPKTAKQIESIMNELAYVVIDGTAYRVIGAYSADEDVRKDEYNNGVPQPYLNVVEDEGEDASDDDYYINLSKLADRTDVEFLTLVHI